MTTSTSTSTDGPWCHNPVVSDKPNIACYDIGDKLTPLQATIIDELDNQNEREILFVHGDVGCIGKTTLGMYLALHRDRACRVPAAMESAEDILQWCYAFLDGTTAAERGTVILDVPRTIQSENQWNKFMFALEDIKTGYLYDKRYTAKVKFVYPPKVVVFSNSLPSGGLTSDRFVELRIDDFVASGQVVPFKKAQRRIITSLGKRSRED